MNVYEDLRRAVSYLRGRKGDADSIAPSLYPGRPRRRAVERDAAHPGETAPAAGAKSDLSATLPGIAPPADLSANKGPFLS